MLYEFKNGMKVQELKELIKDWPEEDHLGQPTEVWVETGRCLSSPVTCAGSLNYRFEVFKAAADFILKSNAFNDNDEPTNSL
jgi:hypothetical protein